MLYPFGFKVFSDEPLGLRVDEMDIAGVILEESMNPMDSLKYLVEFEADTEINHRVALLEVDTSPIHHRLAQKYGSLMVAPFFKQHFTLINRLATIQRGE